MKVVEIVESKTVPLKDKQTGEQKNVKLKTFKADDGKTYDAWGMNTDLVEVGNTVPNDKFKEHKEQGKKPFAPRGKSDDSPEKRISIEGQTGLKELEHIINSTNKLLEKYITEKMIELYVGTSVLVTERWLAQLKGIQSPTPKSQSAQKSITDPLPTFETVTDAGKWFTERGITKDSIKTFGKADTAAEIEIIGVNEWAQSLKIELIKNGIGG